MCGYLYIGFLGFMLKGKSCLEYTNVFFPNEYEMNENTWMINTNNDK